jgi:O-antigen/teichoic acid export membrane protein
MERTGIVADTQRLFLRVTETRFFAQIVGSDIVRKIMETFATRVLLIGVGLVTTVIVARILGPTGRGLYAVAFTVGALGIQFGNLGLHTSNTYFAARNKAHLSILVGNSLFVSLVIASLGAGLVWIFFLIWPRFSPLQGALLGLSLLSIPLGLAYLLLQNLLLGVQEVRSYNQIELANKLLSIVLIALVILSHVVKVETVFAAGLVAVFVSLFWALACLRGHVGNPLSLSFAFFQENLKYGMKAYLSSFFAFLMLRVDLLMVQYMKGAELAGQYSVAASMVDMVYIFPAVVGTIIFPKLSALENNADKWRLSVRTSLIVGLIMLPLAGSAAILAKPAVSILFGRPFLPAVPAFLWLLPGILFYGASFSLQYLLSIGLPRFVLWIWLFVVFFNISLNSILIPQYGIIGASWVSSLTYIACFLLFTGYAWRRSNA